MKPRLIMTAKQLDESFVRIAKEIVKDGTSGVALVGIRTRGVPIAESLAKKIQEVQKKPIDVGILDINLYRDDLSEVGEQPLVKSSSLPFDMNGKGIILVDDVLYTGRNIRAAMDALIDYGRPKFIKLMVVVDRGWREFPIQADYIGKKLETDADENVKVMLQSIDGEDQVVVKKQT